jgi:dinuclear metal center YbgI/SA1388 family protein
MLTVARIINFLEEFAPTELAASWDNVGLLLGDRSNKVKRVLTCLTVTPEVVAEAVEEKAQLIVTHHPIFFRPVKRLTADHPEGRMLLRLAKASIAVYSPHTAFDNTRGGINDAIARKLGLAEVGPLRRREAARQCKVVVFVPDADLGKVSDALFAAGAGHIGQYSECSFRLAGTGTFFGSDATNPTVGQKGRREDVSEWRLEVVCPEAIVDRVVAAMRKAHSYEEPAFDVYPLRPGSSSIGEGRVGRLPQPALMSEVARVVKFALAADLVQTVGKGDQKIDKVAIACGSGSEMLSDVFRARADLFITGELRFHDYLAAQAQGVALCLPGHYATERFGIEELAVRLQERFPELTVWPSRSETNPVTLIV